MKLGIVGNGKIVKMALDALVQVPQIERMAICVRPKSQQQGDALAGAYGIHHVYTDYDLFLKDVTIDTVYIGIINTLHYAYARKALEAGKHVILEKPFTSTLEQAEELAELARARQLFLFEAITTMHLPLYPMIRDFLPLIGPVRMVLGNFSQISSRYPDYLNGVVQPAFDPEMEGGSLRDLNVYQLHLTIALFGKPKAVQHEVNRGFNGIDTSDLIIMKYPGFIASLSAAKDSASENFYIIQGETGWVKVHGAASVLTEATLYEQGQTKHLSDDPNKRMIYEFAHMARMIQERSVLAATALLRHSIDVTEVLCAIEKVTPVDQ